VTKGKARPTYLVTPTVMRKLRPVASSATGLAPAGQAASDRTGVLINKLCPASIVAPHSVHEIHPFESGLPGVWPLGL
jgi:hypothetical protein